jgi:hypothetical protein
MMGQRGGLGVLQVREARHHGLHIIRGEPYDGLSQLQEVGHEA